jgi:ankyrin repeat protein
MKKLLLLLSIFISFFTLGCVAHEYQLGMESKTDTKQLYSSPVQDNDKVFNTYVSLLNSPYISQRLKDFLEAQRERVALDDKFFYKNEEEENDFGDYYSFLEYAALKGRKEVVEYLIQEFGCDPNSTTGNLARGLLHLGAMADSIPFVGYLIEKKGADVNKADANGSLPIHHAVACNKVDITKYFFKKNVDVKRVDKNGFTVLHLAALAGSTPLIELCLTHIQGHLAKEEARALVNYPTNKGLTALHIAANSCDTIAIDRLLEAGADKKVKTKRLERYPYQIAEKKRKLVTAEKLRFQDEDQKEK